MDSFSIHSGEASTSYKLISGGFDVSPGGLDIALELEVNDTGCEEFPPEILLRFSNLPAQVGTAQVEDYHESWGADDGRPHAYVYSQFHHRLVRARVTVSSMDLDRLLVEFEVSTDDLGHYDERATKTLIIGSCNLGRDCRDSLWSP
jgi:hypothetical protein